MASSLSTRSVFLKLHPSARTFAERREVLRVLERFGEVTMFKSQKYDPRNPTPNTFLALFASESAAQDLINASPIRYRLISNPNPSSFSPPLEYTNSPSALADSSTLSSSGPSTAESQDPSATSHQQQSPPEIAQQSTPSSPPPSSNDPKPEGQPILPDPEPPQEHPYQLHAYSSYFNHTLYLRSPLHNPLHGPYTPIHKRATYISSSLAQNIPPSIMGPGLIDWETDSRFGRMGLGDIEGPGGEERVKGQKGGEDGMEGEGGKEGEEKQSTDASFWFNRRQQMKAAKEKSGVMNGLRQLRQEYEAREREREMEAEWERSGGFASTASLAKSSVD